MEVIEQNQIENDRTEKYNNKREKKLLAGLIVEWR